MSTQRSDIPHKVGWLGGQTHRFHELHHHFMKPESDNTERVEWDVVEFDEQVFEAGNTAISTDGTRFFIEKRWGASGCVSSQANKIGCWIWPKNAVPTLDSGKL